MNLEEMENPGALFKYENDNIHFFENSPFNTKTREGRMLDEISGMYSSLFGSKSSPDRQKHPVVFLPDGSSKPCKPSGQMSTFGYLSFILSVVNSVVNAANNINNNNNNNNNNDNNNNNNNNNVNIQNSNNNQNNNNMLMVGRRLNIENIRRIEETLSRHYHTTQTGNGTVLSLQWKDFNSGQNTSQSVRGSQDVLKNGDQTVPAQGASINNSQSVRSSQDALKIGDHTVPAQGALKNTSQSVRGSQDVLKNGDRTVPALDASKNASQSVLDDLGAFKNSAQTVPFAQGSSKANRISTNSHESEIWWVKTVKDWTTKLLNDWSSGESSISSRRSIRRRWSRSSRFTKTRSIKDIPRQDKDTSFVTREDLSDLSVQERMIVETILSSNIFINLFIKTHQQDDILMDDHCAKIKQIADLGTWSKMVTRKLSQGLEKILGVKLDCNL
ncbi:myb-like protein A [Eurytemora carolleeae]|uniref:myb-like protein A n=1 Tax=Eurytemora carolleeae TaxID=1294199 RepID=UPI000C79114F|nr:myb-like protein A [Eurytemora carolleeae]|eukprot:XP_023321444.1 myb-like protein A [Eurytemora affinis]